MFQTTNQIKHYKLYLLQDDYLYTWYLHQYLKFYLPKKGKTTMQLKHTETQCARTWGFHMCEPPGDVSTHLCMYVYIYIYVYVWIRVCDYYMCTYAYVQVLKVYICNICKNHMYPPVDIQRNYIKSQFMGQLIVHNHFQELIVRLPEGITYKP